MNLRKMERLLQAQTRYDLLSVMHPNTARLLRLSTVALLPPVERREVLGKRGGPARLARAFLELEGGTPEDRALKAYQDLWGKK